MGSLLKKRIFFKVSRKLKKRLIKFTTFLAALVFLVSSIPTRVLAQVNVQAPWEQTKYLNYQGDVSKMPIDFEVTELRGEYSKVFHNLIILMRLIIMMRLFTI